MDRRDLMRNTGVAAVLTAAAFVPGGSHAAPAGGPAALDGILKPYLAEYKLPAVAAAVVMGGIIAAAGAVGTRRAGANIPVAIDDRFHIGSDTKAMTALLAAMLVEQNKLRWDSSVAEIFPELTASMAPEIKPVRLDQLLSHTSGIPSDNPAQDKLILRSFAQGGLNLDELRYWLVKELLPMPLQSKPGERFAYSNMGYVLAGAMIERVGGASWEELVASRIFDPLGLKTAGFGPQSSLGRVDAPLGHLVRPDGSLKPMLAGPNGDNPDIIGPAGTVHLSILDFATWAGWNAGGGRRGPALVRPATLQKLQTPVIDIPPRPDAKPGTPPPGRYALGWGTAAMPFAPEPLLFHGGSNEMNLAYVILEPKKDFAMVMATNVAGEPADKALRAIGAELYKRFVAIR
jgi:CubicO group peptidase (beta-lactamase class C family)